jgi:A/G-specific adenine glycosylase
MGSAVSEWLSRLSENSTPVEALLRWYGQEGRRLPWRDTYDLYQIWITETLLQQTRIAQAQSTLERFFTRFPTLEVLARSPIEEVLAVWQGLGYYQRAHNLHRAARILCERGGLARWIEQGESPLSSLLKLPGVGPYTARAILSFSERGAYLPVDGNLVRVLSRLWADTTPASQRGYYQTLADSLPGEWRRREVAFALMDLGNLRCLPRKPLCLLCPLAPCCTAHREGKPAQYPPRRTQRQDKPIRAFRFWLYATAEAVWLQQQPSKGLWGGLWSPPLEEISLPSSELPDFRHELTHFRLWGYVERKSTLPPLSRPVPWQELGRYGLPAPIRRLLTHEAQRIGVSFPS